MAEGPTIWPQSVQPKQHTHLKLINTRFWFNRTTSLCHGPYQHLHKKTTEKNTNFSSKHKTKAIPSTRKCQQNHVSITQWRMYTTLVQHVNPYTARVRQSQRPNLNNTGALWMDPTVKKKSEDCKFRPGWRFDRGVMGLQLSLLFFPDPLKMGLSKTASGTATQQKEVWWLNNIWKRVMVYKMRCAVSVCIKYVRE